MKTTLYLARHGETQWNKEQRFQGLLDSELTELGKQQSQQLAIEVNDKKINVIVSSLLGRAFETANICQQRLNVDVKTVAELAERNLGVWQGQQIAQIKNHANYGQILQQFTHLAPSGGESAHACGKRIYLALERFAQQAPNDNVLAIFHGEALRCFLSLLGQKLHGNAYHLFKNGCLIKLIYDHQSANFQVCLS